MNENSTLGAIKRRWWIILLFALVGAVLGATPEPDKVEDLERTFRATHTLLLSQDDLFGRDGPVSPTQLTLFASTGEVPARVAATLEFSGNAATLAGQISPAFDQQTGALTITSTQVNPRQAEIVADAFADELVSYLTERQDSVHSDRLAASLERQASVEADLIRVTRDLAANPEDPVLQAQQNAISRQYSVAFEQAEALSEVTDGIGLTSLQRAQAVEVTQSGLGAPKSRQSRALLGAAAGAALGVGIALVLGRLDRRIRTRQQAEEVTQLRAQAIIPRVRDSDRDGIVVVSERHDPLSDAYRTVRNLVTFIQNSTESEGRAHITLVASPSPGDGKTSLAVNLAAAMAEAGQRTVLMNTDFRRPRMSKALGPDADDPTPYLLADLDRVGVTALTTKSGRSNLRVFDLSKVDATAVDLMRVTKARLDELAAMSDHIVIDSSPVGATAEVLDLVPLADTIVMLTRLGHTKIGAAQRALAIVRDLSNAPLLLVLGGVKRERSEYYEYSDRRSRREKKVTKKQRRRAKKVEAPDTTAAEASAVLEIAGLSGVDESPFDATELPHERPQSLPGIAPVDVFDGSGGFAFDSEMSAAVTDEVSVFDTERSTHGGNGNRDDSSDHDDDSSSSIVGDEPGEFHFEPVE